MPAYGFPASKHAIAAEPSPGVPKSLSKNCDRSWPDPSQKCWLQTMCNGKLVTNLAVNHLRSVTNHMCSRSNIKCSCATNPIGICHKMLGLQLQEQIQQCGQQHTWLEMLCFAADPTRIRHKLHFVFRLNFDQFCDRSEPPNHDCCEELI